MSTGGNINAYVFSKYQLCVLGETRGTKGQEMCVERAEGHSNRSCLQMTLHISGPLCMGIVESYTLICIAAMAAWIC